MPALMQTLAAVDGFGLGTSVRLVVTDAEGLGAAKTAVDSVISDIDTTCSRFRDDSELAWIQRNAGRECRVSPTLGMALRAALRAARLTGGAVDPTVGAAMKAAGYDADFESIRRSGEPIEMVANRVPGWRRIQFDEFRRTLTIPAGVELDLGSTAKALAADLAASAACRAVGGCGVLVSLGGDIAVAGESPPDGWRIQLAEDSGTPMLNNAETVAILSGGLATSSTMVRRWTRGDAVLHHIIDPATGLPAKGIWRTVSVTSRNCVDANMAATASIVLGDEAAGWLARHGFAARVVDQEGRVARVGGWA